MTFFPPLVRTFEVEQDGEGRRGSSLRGEGGKKKARGRSC